MSNVKTATGRELECDYFNPFPPLGQINLRIKGVPLTEVASIFNDPTETAALHWENQYAALYTKLIALVQEPDAIRVVLGKE